MLSEDVDAGILATQTSVGLLRVRVRDDIARDLAQRLLAGTATIATSHSEGASETAMLEMASIFSELQERIGELLRNLDDDEEHVSAVGGAKPARAPGSD